MVDLEDEPDDPTQDVREKEKEIADKTRGLCPSCYAKRLEQWGEWMRETLLLDVPHRQVVFTIPRRRCLSDFRPF